MIPNRESEKIKEEFWEVMRKSLGDQNAIALQDSLSKKSTECSIRRNPFKTNSPLFTHNPNNLQWCPEGEILPKRIKFTFDPSLHCGLYYVQDSSSMYPALLSFFEDEAGERVTERLIKKPLKILDLCAAPGGKATHIISKIAEYSNESIVVVNEYVRKRVPPLSDNIARWGGANVVVTCLSAKELCNRLSNKGAGYFDLIIADVPCSGEGMLQKKEEVAQKWSLSYVKECALRERTILSDIWPALKPGGLMLYSTCTYNHFENGDNIEYICNTLGATPLKLSNYGLSLVKGLLPVGNSKTLGYQFVAGITQGGGQFFSLLKKSDGKESRSAEFQKKIRLTKLKPITVTSAIENHQSILEDYLFIRSGDKIQALPHSLAEEMCSIGKALGAESNGVAIAQIKGKEIIPDADFALSLLLHRLLHQTTADKRESMLLNIEGCGTLRFAVAEVDKSTALRYLAKQSISPHELKINNGAELHRGYVLITYNGFGVGFAKNVGNRLNNLLPNGRRILSDITATALDEESS